MVQKFLIRSELWPQEKNVIPEENYYLTNSMFVWLVADGWCWSVLREKYYWLVADG
jgi:hypothetical protein